MQEVSSGGVVVFDNTILLLKKFNNDWVLPKGKQEYKENLEETALREVYEETGVSAKIIRYIGSSHYTYTDINNIFISKKVHWYEMEALDKNCKALAEEGFKEAVFIDKRKVVEKLKHNEEKEIVRNMLVF